MELDSHYLTVKKQRVTNAKAYSALQHAWSAIREQHELVKVSAWSCNSFISVWTFQVTGKKIAIIKLRLERSRWTITASLSWPWKLTSAHFLRIALRRLDETGPSWDLIVLRISINSCLWRIQALQYFQQNGFNATDVALSNCLSMLDSCSQFHSCCQRDPFSQDSINLMWVHTMVCFLVLVIQLIHDTDGMMFEVCPTN